MAVCSTTALRKYLNRHSNLGQPSREKAVSTTRAHAEGETLIKSGRYRRPLFKSSEGAIEVISHEAPTPWIRLPKFETRLAVQMARKIRCRNGARVEEHQAPRPSSAPAFKG